MRPYHAGEAGDLERMGIKGGPKGVERLQM